MSNGDRKNIVLTVTIVVGVSIFLAFIIINAGMDIFGIGKLDEDVEIEIKDANLGNIAKTLKNNHIIKQKSTFKLYAMLYKKTGKITEPYHTGKFLLNKDMPYNIIIRKLTAEIPQIVKLCFTDGMSIQEVATKLENEGVCNKSDFFNTLNKEIFNYNFLKTIPKNDLRFNKYEGYFLPDTYDFYKNENAKSVINKFLTNFDNKIAEKLKYQIEASNFTVDQLIILASIVQREAGSGACSSRVASVFINRLNSYADYTRRLNSDATKYYVNNFIKPYLNFTNQKIYDAYDTYKCVGLPVGPISNPGLVSVYAVLNPEKTNYYYFLTDANGNYYWAKTLNEHNANIIEANKVNAKSKKNG